MPLPAGEEVDSVIDELDLVALANDVPEHGLKAGDLGTVVHVYRGGKGFEVEFLTAAGDTIAVLTLDRKGVRPFSGGKILHAREVAPA